MKGFIQIRDVNSDVYTINVSQIAYIYRPQVAVENLEIMQKTIFTRIRLSNNIEFQTLLTIEKIEELIEASYLLWYRAV